MSTIREKRGSPASPSTELRRSDQDAGIPNPQRSKIAEFAADTAGEILVMFSLIFMVVFMMIGLAVDYGRFVNARDQTIGAMDAAVLAAGRALQTGSSETAAVEIANKYYKEATKNRLATVSDTVSFVVVDNGTAVQAKGNAYIKTPFMGIDVGSLWKGVDKLALVKDTEADQAKATLAVGGNSELNLEISMMLDVSGSMCNNNNQPCSSGRKLDDMKAAAKDLINIVVWEDQSEFTSKVAIVPFSADVRPPSSMSSAIIAGAGNRSHQQGSGSNRKTYYYAPTPCVAERGGSERYTDAKPTGSNLISRVYTQVSNSSTSSGSCSIATNSTVVPLTSNKTTLTNAVNALVGQGGTAGHVGTAWAYYMLSPNWNNVLSGMSLPAAYGQEKHKKIAILMTDGEYNYTYQALKNSNQSGASTYSPLAAIGFSTVAGNDNQSSGINSASSASQAISICTQMKNRGIEVYTVGFELPNQTAINTLAACATDASHAYNASNGEELKQAFRDIALKVSSLYLSK